MANDDPKYTAWLRTQPCCVCGSPYVQVHHHTRKRSLGVRASDREGMPMCWQHHRDFHSGRGAFVAMKRDERRAWQDERVEQLRAAYAALRDPSIF